MKLRRRMAPTALPVPTAARAKSFGELLEERSQVPLKRMIEHDKRLMQPVIKKYCEIWGQALGKIKESRASHTLDGVEGLFQSFHEWVVEFDKITRDCYFPPIWYGEVRHALGATCSSTEAYCQRKLQLFNVFESYLPTAKQAKLYALIGDKQSREFDDVRSEEIWHAIFGADREYGALAVEDFFEIFVESVEKPTTVNLLNLFWATDVSQLPKNIVILGISNVLPAVLDQIIQNARFALKEKYGENDAGRSKDGKIVANAGTLANGDLKLTLTDDGTGIRSEVLSRIFEPHFTTKGKLGGGMGLNACKEIIELLGGSITIESEYGKGAVVTLIIPKKFVEVC